MRVLLTEPGLYQSMGGGQTAYTKLVARNPGITFYFTVDDPAYVHRGPANAVPIQLPPPGQRFRATSSYLHNNVLFDAFRAAERLAEAVAGMEFDAIDTPDYVVRGLLLRPALARRRVRFGVLAHAMHGVLSKTLRLNWGNYSRRLCAALRLTENLNYRNADVRYGISNAYLDLRAMQCGRRGTLLDPMWLFDRPTPREWPRGEAPPAFYYIGRKDRGKGPDLFVDLMWWMGEGHAAAVRTIGPDATDPAGMSSRMYLENMGQRRHTSVEQMPSMTHEQLAEVYAQRSVVVLPTRADTLNLVALEALLSGCPTAVSDGAGVVRLLEESYPGVPFVRMSARSPHESRDALVELAHNYDRHRARLHEAIAGLDLTPTGPTLREIYSQSPDPDPRVHAVINDLYASVLSLVDATDLDPTSDAMVPPAGRRLLRVGRAVRDRARSARRWMRSIRPTRPRVRVDWKKRLASSVFSGSESLFYQMVYARRLRESFDGFNAISERTRDERTHKCNRLRDMAGHYRVGRARIYREFARLEARRGNDLLAATYKIRVMRWLGADPLGDLEDVTATLRRFKYVREAEALEAIYDPARASHDARREILTRNLHALRDNPLPTFERVDDRRGAISPRVSVIVSLYNAASKIGPFLERLRGQTLLRQGAMEVVLVDSGSPRDEYAAFDAAQRRLGLPIVYVRTKDRETIQAAWNRGLGLARGPYVSFLGVDEAVTPECLERLAGELDRDGLTDWVTGSSIVTNVNKRGVYEADEMVYDRRSFRDKEMHWLDCTYFSYVGALYRRSIHDRVGYYDASFGAAGDNEFKNRALPHINVKVVPGVTGVFLNYPEERATASPRAELEDIRAWYLPRMDAGVSLLFEGRDPRHARALLRDTLNYKKTYTGHRSTDIETAAHVAAWIEANDPGCPEAALAPGIREVLAIYREMDWLMSLAPNWTTTVMLSRIRRLRRIEAQHEAILGGPFAGYKLTNDNRFEQHHWVWPS